MDPSRYVVCTPSATDDTYLEQATMAVQRGSEDDLEYLTS